MSIKKRRASWRRYAERRRRAEEIPVRPIAPWRASGLPKTTFYYGRKHGLPLLSVEKQVEIMVAKARKQMFRAPRLASQNRGLLKGYVPHIHGKRKGVLSSRVPVQ